MASSQRSDSGNTLRRKMGDILKEMLITTQRKERQVRRRSETLSTGGKQGLEAQTSVGGVRSGAGWGRLSACCEEAVMQVCSPDVEQHQHERADDDSLEDLPVAAQVGYDGHQQLAAQHQEAGHHVHGKAPLWQADLEP